MGKIYKAYGYRNTNNTTNTCQLLQICLYSKKGIKKEYTKKMPYQLQQDIIKDLEEYYEKYNEEPFSTQTIEARELFMIKIAKQRKNWISVIEDLDLAKNSNKAWKLIKKKHEQ